MIANFDPYRSFRTGNGETMDVEAADNEFDPKKQRELLIVFMVFIFQRLIFFSCRCHDEQP